jgi:peptide/nickel transport system ATP-binding protein
VSAATLRPPVLEASSLTRHFPLQTGAALGRRTLLRAVQEVDLSLRPGAVTALVGESGSGKSTVARLLALLDRPTAGAIRYGDVDATRLRGRRRVLRYRSEVQLIFQDPFASLNPAKRVEHHVARPLRIHRIVPRKLVHMRVVELLESVGLVPGEEFVGKYPHELSGGQRQRVAIARALAVEPKVLLADEPISMLDVSIRAGILNLMLELKEQREIAFLYITHDLASARYVADEVLVMLSGRIVERGPTDAVLHEPLHPYTQLLLSAVPDPEAGRERPALIRPDLAALDADAPLVEARPGHWVRMEVAQ